MSERTLIIIMGSSVTRNSSGIPERVILLGQQANEVIVEAILRKDFKSHRGQS